MQIILVHRHGNVFVSWNAIDFSMRIVSGIASVIKCLSAFLIVYMHLFLRLPFGTTVTF